MHKTEDRPNVRLFVAPGVATRLIGSVFPARAYTYVCFADSVTRQVSGSDTSADEAKAGWVDLRGLGQGHYCGYLQKKSRRDPSLWRRRWCILAVRAATREWERKKDRTRKEWAREDKTDEDKSPRE